MKQNELKVFEAMFHEVNSRPRDSQNFILSDNHKSISGYLYVNALNMVHVQMPHCLGGAYGSNAGENGIRTSAFDTTEEACEFVAELFDDFNKLIQFVTLGKSGVYLKPGERPKTKKLKLEEKPADTEFGYILSKVEIGKLVKLHGQAKLIAARKTMTVGEFLEEYS